MKDNISEMILKVCFEHIVQMSTRGPFSDATFEWNFDVANCLLLWITSYDDFLISYGCLLQWCYIIIYRFLALKIGLERKWLHLGE